MINNVKFVTCNEVKTMVNGIDCISNGTFIFCNQNERFYLKMKNKIIAITPALTELHELKCKSCGATLTEASQLGTVVKCEFCGSIYELC